jgi:uncharacterized protein (TIGR00661 family)
MPNKKIKILYAIQGTGNGHITRAIEIIPHLQKKADVDILVSSIESEINLPFPVKYIFKGLSLSLGKDGGIDIWKTYWKLNSRQFIKDINSLPIQKYDLVISDFEPVSSWAAIKAKKPCIGLSNQVATLHPLAPKPSKKNLFGKLVLKNYAPTMPNYGFHFKSLDPTTYTPIIRKEIREAIVTQKGHYTVYLPAYSDEKIIKHLAKFEHVNWQIFSKKNKKKKTVKNITLLPINKDSFIDSILSCEGVLCNAGFGTTSEALFLKKKLLVIPMKKHCEQHCNAEMLQSMGVPVIKSLKAKHYPKITEWIESKEIVAVHYPDVTEKIVDNILNNYTTLKKMEINFDFELLDYNLFV